MRTPVIVVTGAIASGKTTVARVIAARGGAIVDCDLLAHRAFNDDGLKENLTIAFGRSVFTPTRRVSRARLGRIVFSDDSKMNRFNSLVRPFVKRIINNEVRKLEGVALYIVLDAVLFFQYKFSFKADLVVMTEASEETRLIRLMKQRGMVRGEALIRIERQRPLYEGWARADFTIRTDGPKKRVVDAAKKIRDRFLEEYHVF
ncbi:MAG: dephospho-CoA kinase [Candidatus Krumholzibacteria bacterium]|nr:dephospho-CoA kinase [Candidatus Krumholzibacteria bacterium]